MSFGVGSVLVDCFRFGLLVLVRRSRLVKYSVNRGSYGVASALILICRLIATELALNKST